MIDDIYKDFPMEQIIAETYGDSYALIYEEHFKEGFEAQLKSQLKAQKDEFEAERERIELEKNALLRFVSRRW